MLYRLPDPHGTDLAWLNEDVFSASRAVRRQVSSTRSTWLDERIIRLQRISRRIDAGNSTSSHKVAVVTGAPQGIGAGVADAFRGAGYAVVATSRSINASDQSDFLTVRGDIAEAETAQSVVELAVRRFGRIDSLINNAGIFIGKPFTDYTLDDFSRSPQ